MKQFRILIGAIALIVFASCSKELTIDPLAFDVTTASTTYQVGDTVNFKFTGNSEFISFFSGEEGHNYDFRERTSIDGAPQLQFTSYAQYGAQQNSLQLMVSNNFNGIYDVTNVGQATWTDITSRATLSSGANNTPSGIIDLSDFLAQKKPIFFAFKYTGVTGSTQKTWTINNLTLDLLTTSNGLLPITNLASAGWKQVSFLNPAAVWTFNATQVRIAGGNASADDNEDWAITKLLYLNNVAPDVAVAIKNVTQKLDSYDYVFTQPGTYKVVFLAANATADNQASTTKEVTLTIQ